MSDDVKDETHEKTEAEAATEMVAEGAPVAEPVADPSSAPAADELSPDPDEVAPADEPVAEEAPAEETATEEQVAQEPAEAAAGEPVADDEPVVDAVMAFEEVEVPASVSEAFGPVRIARVFVCEKGHRTTTLWGLPEICQAKPLRSGPVCGMPLYHITELPEQVQKALNPLKASKKASKKK